MSSIKPRSGIFFVYGIILSFLVIGSARLWRQELGGFSKKKIEREYPFEEKWQVTHIESLSLEDKLNQPFYFLGKGAQSYAFVGKDNATVLKVFKHHHFGFSSQTLHKLSLPSFLEKQRDKILLSRRRKVEQLFDSLVLAYTKIPEQTGLVYLQLNQAQERYPLIHVHDPLGCIRTIDLNQVPFAIQKRATPFFTELETHPEQFPQVIDSLFQTIDARMSLGIVDHDPVFYRNLGVLDGKVISIDVGSFKKASYLATSLGAKKELFYEVACFRDWLAEYAPEHCPLFDQKLKERLEEGKPPCT